MINKYKHLIFILFISILILWFDFFFKSGTYFLLDLIFSPIYSLKNNFFEVSIFFIINDFLNLIFWNILYSKIFYFWVVFFSWLLWYLFWIQIINWLKINEKYKNIAWFSWILFIMLNPFFYERMITQPWVYLSIIWLWYWLYFLLKNINKNYLLSWLFFGLSITISPHTSFMILTVLLLYFIIFIRRIKDLLNLFYLWLIIIFININWLIWAFIVWKSNVINSISTFWQWNIDNFTSNSLNNLWVEFTNLLLYWFWWEKYWHFFLPDKLNNKWYFAWSIILIVVFFWIFKLFNKNKKLTLYLVLLWIISFILWVWTASNIFGNITTYLYNNIPYYIWLREPQKWIWLLMIIYLIFFIIWAIYIFKYFEKIFNLKEKKYGFISFLTLIFIFLNSWSPNVIFAFNKQLFITNFPEEYKDFKKNKISEKETYLILPWHSYIACGWTKRRVIQNIMWEYFRPWNTIVSDNIEVWNLYSNSNSKQSKDIELFLKNKNINLLKKYNINNIILLDKCADFPSYSFLEKNKNLEKIYNSTYLKSYKIKYEK